MSLAIPSPNATDEGIPPPSKLYLPPHRRGLFLTRGTSPSPNPLTSSSSRDVPSHLGSRNDRFPRSKPASRPRYREARPHFHSHGLHTGLGAKVCTLALGEVALADSAEFGEVAEAGSFKWVVGPRGGPTIAVPGIPDEWLGRRDIGVVVHDSEIRGNMEWRDYQGAHLPPGVSEHESTLLSLTDPGLLRATDILTSRNNLRKLFSHCQASLFQTHSGSNPTAVPIHPRDPVFRIDAHVIPGTDLVLFDRHTPHNGRPCQPAAWHLAYHEAATRRVLHGADGTPGCFRVVKYRFGALEMMVKFDVDAYHPDEEDAASDTATCGSESDADRSSPRSQAITTTTTHPTSSPPIISTTSSSLTIIRHALPPPPHTSLISLKTRTFHGRDTLGDLAHADELLSSLMFSRVPNLYIARHDRGDFSVSPLEKLRLDDDEVQSEVQGREEALRLMGGVMQWMVGLVKGRGWRKGGVDKGGSREEGRWTFVFHSSEGGWVEVFEVKSGPRWSDEAKEVLFQGLGEQR